MRRHRHEINIWEVAILRSMRSLGGEGGLQEIYRELQKFIDLSDSDLATTQWGGRPAYQHQVRSHITNLCQAGQLENVARGRYALTKGGRTRIDEGDEGPIVEERPQPTSYRLSDLLADITKANRHDAMDYGRARGREVW